MKTKIVTLIITMSFSLLTRSQDSLNLDGAFRNAKCLLLQELPISGSKIDPCMRFVNSYTSTFLNSKGFGDNIHFIRINFNADSLLLGDSLFISNKYPRYCEYIVAYYEPTRLLYKIKGFRKDDVVEMFDHLKKNSPGTLFSMLLIGKKKKLMSSALSIGTILIENIDLECLLEYYFAIKNNKLTQPECIISCYSRDSKLPK